MPYSLTAFLQRFMRNEDGVISVMAVGALVLALAIAMIVIDTGSMYAARRYQQAATDAAALGAVRQLQSAQTTESVAATVLDINGYDADDLEVVRGIYSPNPSVLPADRFQPEGAGVDESELNAVRITKTSESPTYFARIFGFGDSTNIQTQSIAAYTKYVSFSAGTRLASLDEGLANQVLGGLLGTTVNLSLVDYTSLANADIDALAFLDALATEVGLDAGTDTYGDLLETTATVGDILDAAIEVLNGETFEGDPSVAKVALQSALLPIQNASIPLDQLLGAAPILDRTIGSIQSLTRSEVPYNLLDLLTGTAMILGQGEAVGFSTNLNLGSLASVSGTISVGAPMAHMAIGKVGDSVQTSQVTVQLNATIDTGILALVDSRIEVPIYISAAEGTATVRSIPCLSGSTLTTLGAQTGAATVRYGTASDTQPKIAEIQAKLFSLGPTLHLLDVYVSGEVSVAGGGEVPVNFTQDDIDNNEMKTVSSDTTLFSRLGSAASFELVALPGFGGLSSLLSILGSLVTNTLSSLLTAITQALVPLDTVVNSLLTTLGVKLGAMDMTVHGAKCRAPTLVS